MIEIDGIKFWTEGDPGFFLPAWAPVKPGVVLWSEPQKIDDWSADPDCGYFQADE